MKPYYEHAGITIYHGDCREVLPLLAGFDLLLTDPPYGIADKWKGGFTGIGWEKSRLEMDERNSWDNEPASNQTLSLFRAISTKQIIWGGNYFDLPPSRCWIVWDKMNPEDFSLADAELAWTNLDHRARIHREMSPRRCWGERQHPTQKPLGLILFCMKVAGESELVLDPFMGSGTTLRAAKDLGRRAIGIEIHEPYCEIAAKRLQQEVFEFEVKP